jgi:hypothetical protein
MKAYRYPILIVLTFCIILLIAAPVAARATRISYEADECALAPWGEPERMWVSEDGVMHMRGVFVENLIESENPYLAGINRVYMNLDLNPATGEGHASGTVLITPFAKNGTWEGRFSTHISPNGIRGKSVVHGTGELIGMKMFNHMLSSAPNAPCHNDIGYILLP